MKYNYNRVTFCNMKNKNQLQPFAFKQKSGGGGAKIETAFNANLFS
ncbi:hypothetical protein [Helicobacter japonicus]|nr:hypothetical protein [Helicobacter japonicus]